MNDKLLGIRPDASVHEVENEYRQIRWFIGNTFDFMRGGAGADDDVHALGMYIDDEGMLDTENVLNLAASLLVQYPVYGSAIVCAANTDADGDTRPPSQHIRKVVEGIAGMVTMLHINAHRVGQDLTVHPNPDTIPPPTILSGEEVEAYLRGDRTI